ncbi:MAG: GTPase HflX [gamma proteobacterium symbiont of Bathyaustriella thionipta]|nr:GTPase HflX [gamma proteobacterium symbiont of Bathyaustriella thionipta]MCU7948798.1 GTPase HflX [gamma proteobacterium symbiont of Bathyaustriella thionipta]MCU7954210.1 GTPase HflX [gamma proteobacterium symbiont of Bathyaustriella thionipta]MCU7955256.1 GTPase HflX [gamma proteobacterium symbiont of Bathyaustriella thionipta]MCU7966265.1 GTPase HflX [gamma proteobacterium symbiont of Bathyaustriella thionipta]
MFERPVGTGERALLVHIDFPQAAEAKKILQNEAQSEFYDLVMSAGAEPLAFIKGKRYKAEAKYFIGTGKAQEIKEAVQTLDADLVIVNHQLSPSQERNLEALLECRVIDRTGLILDIFAQRARSHEGKLQVELAQLSHMTTRLVRGWTHLERQKGGIGLRGPGETQLETDRRLLNVRIKQLNKRLDKVRKQREQSRRSRQRAELPTVSLVGYTNAGKSTLFNQLTKSSVYAADQLFATLDPTLRRVELPQNLSMVLADTVGFISDLPHDLVEAFHATLLETREADLLLHLIDAHAENRNKHIAEVNSVLKQVGAQETPQLLVYNKVDLLEGQKPRIEKDNSGNILRVWLSSITDDGLDLLLESIADYFSKERVRKKLKIPPHAGQWRAMLFYHVDIIEEQYNDMGDWLVSIEMSTREFDKLMKQKGFSELIIDENSVS